MEANILGAIMASRNTFDLVNEHLTDKDYSREYQLVKKNISSYYERDPSATHVDHELLVAQMEATTGNKKHQERFATLIREAHAHGSSAANVDSLIISSKMEAVMQKIALAAVNKTDPSEHMADWQRLKGIESLSDLNVKGVEILDSNNFRDVFAKKAEGTGLLKVYPLALNEFLNGGVGPGHHIITFARPEMGKTAFNITIACGFANQGAKGIYFLNEDVLDDVYARAVSCLTGAPEEQLVKDIAKWEELARKRGLENIMFVSLSPGTPADIERFIEQFEPKWIVVDQLRNLQMKETNKVLQLEYAASAMRNIGKKHGVIVVSTTQAGDSAEGKRLLDMGDVDFSNTGIPAQADVLIGIGATREDEAESKRWISICKNKRGGGHATVPLKLLSHISRYRDNVGLNQGS